MKILSGEYVVIVDKAKEDRNISDLKMIGLDKVVF